MLKQSRSTRSYLARCLLFCFPFSFRVYCSTALFERRIIRSSRRSKGDRDPGEPSHAHAGLNQFSASAPAKQVYKKFGLTGEDMATRAEKVIKHYKSLGHPVYSPVSTQLAV